MCLAARHVGCTEEDSEVVVVARRKALSRSVDGARIFEQVNGQSIEVMY